MRIRIISVGTRMPAWVEQGWHEYARRMPKDCALELTEIKAEPRNSGKTTAQIMQAEAQRIRQALTANALLIALDERGHAPTTLEFSQHLTSWRQEGHDVIFLIGGPDGMEAELKQQAALRWRLSSLTLPHPLVRVVLAEQIYRAWAITQNHPYHRQ